MNRSPHIRLMTYNVHGCIGQDGKVSPSRIAAVIKHYAPDVVALQEVDVLRARTGYVHQAEKIAEYLGMDFYFYPSVEMAGEKYGNAILSRFPLRKVQAGLLPTLEGRRALERRAALWAAIRLGDREIQIINTHLGLRRRERKLQTGALLGAEWTGGSCCPSPVFLCGDFNAFPLSGVYRLFCRVLKDAQACCRGARPCNTYPSRYPLARIDHVFLSPGMMVREILVPRTPATSVASDHLPLIVEACVS